MQDHILFFNVGEKGLRNKIRNAFLKINCTVTFIEKEQYHQTIGQLAGVLPIRGTLPPYMGDELPSTMVIFAGVSNTKLDEILDLMREKNYSFPYKACLTMSNSHWLPMQCFAELKKEHDATHA